MKKRGLVLLAAMVLLLSFVLSGCSKKETKKDLLAQIQEKGEITIAMEGTWAPWTYHDENDNLVGYDVEIGEKIAEKLGVKPVFIEGDWDSCLAGLESGRYDIMINGVDVDEERSKKYDFSTPYCYNRIALIVKGDNQEITSFEDLDGKNTANTLNSSYAKLAESHGATNVGADDLIQTIELVLTGRVDATLNSEMTFYDYLKEHPDADLKVVALTEDATETAIPLRKGEETASLRKAINEALSDLSKSGELTELSEKYFGRDISQK